MLHNVTFIDESDGQVMLPIECDPKVFERFGPAFDTVAKQIPLEQRKLLANYLKDNVSQFRIVIEDKVLLEVEKDGKRETAAGLVEPNVASIRFAGTVVAEMSDDQVLELIAHELGHAVLYVEEKTGHLPNDFVDEFIALGGLGSTLSADKVNYLNEKYADKYAEEWGFPQSDLTNFQVGYAKRHDLKPISRPTVIGDDM